MSESVMIGAVSTKELRNALENMHIAKNQLNRREQERPSGLRSTSTECIPEARVYNNPNRIRRSEGRTDIRKFTQSRRIDHTKPEQSRRTDHTKPEVRTFASSKVSCYKPDLRQFLSNKITQCKSDSKLDHAPVKPEQTLKSPVPPKAPKPVHIFTTPRRSSFKHEDLIYEAGPRLGGDGEDTLDDYIENTKDLENERFPGDGCNSDIPEEVDDDLDVDEDDVDDDFEDDIDEDDLGEDDDEDDGIYDDDGEEDGELSGDDTPPHFSNMPTPRNLSASSIQRQPLSRERIRSSSLNRSNGTKKSSNGNQSRSTNVQQQNWTGKAIEKAGYKSPITASLFPNVAGTIYFPGDGEKVASFPQETRKLLKWRLSPITPIVIRGLLARAGFRLTKKGNDWLVCWGKHMKAQCFKTVREYQKVNHFPGTFQIGRKDRLWRNLSRLMGQYGKKEFNFTPFTYVLPYDFKQLKRAWDDGGHRQKWIMKPPASARGIGIKVVHKWSQIPRKRPVIIQKYLHKPFLINSTKFDLRLYVLVTCYDPLRVYLFDDGLVRFATCKYSNSMKSLHNRYMHLTNYSVNKKNHDAYVNNDDETECQGHKWSLKALWGYLKRLGINTNQVWENIKDVVVKTVVCSEGFVTPLIKQNVRNRYCCNELFGFDVMFDENLKPWVLEVNISPSLHSNSSLDRNIKAGMVKDLFNLAGYKVPQNMSTTATSSTSNLHQFVSEKTSFHQFAPDEKSKRSFYTSHHQDEALKQTILDILTPDDLQILIETEDEYSRRGCFHRIYPSVVSNKYMRYFETPRYYNILLDEWTRKYIREGRRTQLGIALLYSYAEKKRHITADPSHKWSCPAGYNRSTQSHNRSSSAPAAYVNDEKKLKQSASVPVFLPKIKKKLLIKPQTSLKAPSGSTDSKSRQVTKVTLKNT